MSTRTVTNAELRNIMRKMKSEGKKRDDLLVYCVANYDAVDKPDNLSIEEYWTKHPTKSRYAQCLAPWHKSRRILKSGQLSEKKSEYAAYVKATQASGKIPVSFESFTKDYGLNSVNQKLELFELAGQKGKRAAATCSWDDIADLLQE